MGPEHEPTESMSSNSAESNEQGEKEGWLELHIEAPDNMPDVQERIKVLDDYLSKFLAFLTHEPNPDPNTRSFEVRVQDPTKESMVNRLIESQGFTIVDRIEK